MDAIDRMYGVQSKVQRDEFHLPLVIHSLAGTRFKIRMKQRELSPFRLTKELSAKYSHLAEEYLLCAYEADDTHYSVTMPPVVMRLLNDQLEVLNLHNMDWILEPQVIQGVKFEHLIGEADKVKMHARRLLGQDVVTASNFFYGAIGSKAALETKIFIPKNDLGYWICQELFDPKKDSQYFSPYSTTKSNASLREIEWNSGNEFCFQTGPNASQSDTIRFCSSEKGEVVMISIQAKLAYLYQKSEEVTQKDQPREGKQPKWLKIFQQEYRKAEVVYKEANAKCSKLQFLFVFICNWDIDPRAEDIETLCPRGLLYCRKNIAEFMSPLFLRAMCPPERGQEAWHARRHPKFPRAWERDRKSGPRDGESPTEGIKAKDKEVGLKERKRESAQPAANPQEEDEDQQGSGGEDEEAPPMACKVERPLQREASTDEYPSLRSGPKSGHA